MMAIGKVEIERATITSSKPFATVVAAVEGAIGRPDIVEFQKAAHDAIAYRICKEADC
jgi:hypothetical protein